MSVSVSVVEVEEEAMTVARTVVVAIMVSKISTIFTIRMSPTATALLPNAADSADGWTREENTDLPSRGLAWILEELW